MEEEFDHKIADTLAKIQLKQLDQGACLDKMQKDVNVLQNALQGCANQLKILGEFREIEIEQFSDGMVRFKLNL